VSTAPAERLYKTDKVLKRTLRVCYPAGHGTLTLRTELDWDRVIEPIEVSADGTTSTFQLEVDQPYVYFKPCLYRAGSLHWAIGPNNLALMSERDNRISYPCFFAKDQGHFSKLIELPSKILNRAHRLRVYLPPGYEENTLATYPVVYMQDGQNLFFPDEAFMGHEWSVDETSDTLRAMRAVDDVIVVGIYSGDRMQEYTRPGYEAYVRSLIEEIVPQEQKLLRGGHHRGYRSMWGSSLGGVVSFYAAWQNPEVFGSAICMSSTFSHKDNLIERVLAEPPRDIGVYLDSGWPGDNYEVTMAMATALIARGWRYGHNLMHLCFPNSAHNESSWGLRLHIPMQFLNGAIARASRILHPVLRD
jgi:predicted alpha/beta superfamily hydrolase